MGITGRINGQDVGIGNRALMTHLQINTDNLESVARGHSAKGETVIFVAIKGQVAGLLCVSDPIKSSTHEAIKSLRGAGLRIVMLTGDNEATANSVAKDLGLDEVVAGVLPDQKNEVIKPFIFCMCKLIQCKMVITDERESHQNIEKISCKNHCILIIL